MPLNSSRGAGSAKGFGFGQGGAGPVDIDILLVAGGGSGGNSGGGGAGGLRTFTSSTVPAGSILTFSVGNGAPGGRPGPYQGGDGGSSQITGTKSFSTLTTNGGGKGGGSAPAQNSGGPGGSGGGGSPQGNGNVGGFSPAEGNPGTGNTSGGAGDSSGAGESSDITGSPVTYSAGMQGSVSPNTGNGGNASFTNPGGSSGVIILKIPTGKFTGKTTGAPTITESGAFKIVQYTGAGTYSNT